MSGKGLWENRPCLANILNRVVYLQAADGGVLSDAMVGPTFGIAQLLRQG